MPLHDGAINNGRLAQWAFGEFKGESRVVERDGRIEIAFRARSSKLKKVQSGTIDGQPCRVLALADSSLIKDMVVLTVEMIAEAAPDAE